MLSKKILLIDDDPSVTKLLQAKLQARGGVIAETSNDARGAVQLAGIFLPDLIVCDIDLGDDSDGGMVAHRLGKDPSTASIPIIYLSSMVTPADVSQQSGGRRLISKKMPFPEIIERIMQEVP